MPCLFLKNLPDYYPDNIGWDNGAIGRFQDRVIEILGSEIEIHLEYGTSYTMLTRDGEIPGFDHGVHGFVIWHEGRTPEQKQRLGDAIKDLLAAHRLDKGHDITFVDLKKGESFYVNGKLVE